MNTTFSERLQEKAAEFQSKMEDLEMKFTLGRNEAIDSFEREWRSFSRFVGEQSERLRMMGYLSEHLLKKLDQVLPELVDALNEPKAEKELAAYQWRERVMRAIYELEFIIGEIFPVLTEAQRDLFSRFRVKMELFRTKLAIMPWNEWDQLSPEIDGVLALSAEVLLWRKTSKEEFQKRVDRLGENVNALFSQLKGTVKEFFK